MKYLTLLMLFPLCAFAKMNEEKLVVDVLEDELFAEEVMESPLDKDIFADIELKNEIVAGDLEVAAEDNSGIEEDPVLEAKPPIKYAKKMRKSSSCRGRPRAVAQR